ncbi:hypothetical protein XU18_4558 [Perkinsela sp. CCAP 1560/4]|nr:hypothetical protein XU18_4558 [Perkinsela sp. CCAP 1560/4]|eukprot:KNH04134.1 hypothetical protein XU18_4558 [Perkinsela sp. CCAP 1560/4]
MPCFLHYSCDPIASHVSSCMALIEVALALPPGGSGIPHSNKQRFSEPSHSRVLVQTNHLAAAVDRVGTKTETRREFGRLLASPTTGYWPKPPRRGGLPSGQQETYYHSGESA